MGVLQDLTGQKFGRLTVLSLDRIEKGMSYWLCVCSCNGINTKIVRRSGLKLGVTQSCGCLIKENCGVAKTLQPSEIEVNDDYGMLKIFNGDGTITKFLFDLEDLETMKKYAWYKNRYGYLEARIFEKDNPVLHKKIKRFHRIILGLFENNETVTGQSSLVVINTTDPSIGDGPGAYYQDWIQYFKT